MRLAILSLAAAFAWACASARPAGQDPAAPGATDPDTRAWWAITTELSSDAYEGRDTGSLGHARAARWLAARFAAAGLQPAGDGGAFLQSVPLHEERVEKAGTKIALVRGGAERVLRFLHEVTVRPAASLPATLDAPLAFRGHCTAAEVTDVRGKAVVCFGGRRSAVPSAQERYQAVAAAGGVAIVNVDDPGFTIEPARWPEAYARSVTLRESAPGSAAPGPAKVASLRLAAAVFPELIEGSGQDAKRLLDEGSASRPLPSFELPSRLQATFALVHSDYQSENVLGVLPGTDPEATAEVVVLSAHLDGYGFGEAVEGDALYNGAFDDAAYVATLLRLAEARAGRGLRRSLLFAAFTGEEKGLLGSTWFTRHPTVENKRLAANVNLDQLRPLFALRILTVHGLADSTLGALAREVAAPLQIELRADREPERHLNERADHFPFLRLGVPALGFVFGYDPGTEAERRAREWTLVRYHRPQDDGSQPFELEAAAAFNQFFYRLVEAIAAAPARPAFVPGSPWAKGAAR